MRVSFVGGGSDLPAYYKQGPGAVVTTAIDCFVNVKVEAAIGDSCTLNHEGSEVVKVLSELRHEIAREVFRRFGGLQALQVSITTDVPTGTGLGSSSAVAVSLLQALGKHNGVDFTPAELAEEACTIELERLGRPIGKQDQYAAAFGGALFLEFQTNGSVRVEPLQLSPSTRAALDERLMFFFAGIRGDCCSLLAEQQKATASDAAKRRALDQMVELAWEMRSALQANDLSRFGPMLHRNWELKRSLHPGISSGAIDSWYQAALQAGAEAGKILGAGGGGFLFLYCDPEKQPAVCEAMRAYSLRQMSFSMCEKGSTLLTGDPNRDAAGRGQAA